MTRRLPPILAAALAACGLAACGSDITYKPSDQLLPQNIKKIAVRNALNKTQQFGLEDKLTWRVRDEFLRDGQYRIVPEADSDGIVQITINRYLLVPIQSDANLIPTAYKLRIVIDLTFIERATNTSLWVEQNLEGIDVYPAPTLPGGKTEEQAREAIWDVLARDVVKRVVEGFGSVTGSSERWISPKGKSTPPTVKPGATMTPVNPNPY